MTEAYDKKCEELLLFSTESTEFISKLRDQTVMLNQQVDSHRKEAQELRQELDDIKRDLFAEEEEFSDR
jgi:hypothetical protein